MQGRGGEGLINIMASDRNGKVVSLLSVSAADEIMLITAHGIIIRTGLDQLRSIGRNTQGVRLIKLRAGDKLVAAAKIASEHDEDEDKPSSAKSNNGATKQTEEDKIDEVIEKADAKAKSVAKAKKKTSKKKKR
jgi:DNA gyrase subunit A